MKKRKLRYSEIVWKSEDSGFRESAENILAGSRAEDERNEDVQEGSGCRVFEEEYG